MECHSLNGTITAQWAAIDTKRSDHKRYSLVSALRFRNISKSPKPLIYARSACPSSKQHATASTRHTVIAQPSFSMPLSARSLADKKTSGPYLLRPNDMMRMPPLHCCYPVAAPYLTVFILSQGKIVVNKNGSCFVTPRHATVARNRFAPPLQLRFA